MVSHNALEWQHLVSVAMKVSLTEYDLCLIVAAFLGLTAEGPETWVLDIRDVTDGHRVALKEGEVVLVGVCESH